MLLETSGKREEEKEEAKTQEFDVEVEEEKENEELVNEIEGAFRANL